MKRIIILIILILAAWNLTPAQSPLAELDKVKEIKLLESTREDVRKILVDYKLQKLNDSAYFQTFSKKNLSVEVSYSSEQCPEDPEDLEDSDDWNVPEGTVTEIEISFDKPVQPANLNINLLSYKKEKKYHNLKQPYVYHDRDAGIGFEVNEKGIQKIYLIPRRSNYFSLCSSQKANEAYSSKSWFNKELKGRIYETPDTPADVVGVSSDKEEIIFNCPANSEKCVEEKHAVTITVVAQDAQNDVLTYNYFVSGGKIIGQGAKVTWDLSGEKPGNYTITAGVDDGCGVCGKTITKTVVVKECPNCSIK